MKGPKALLSSAIAGALAEYFVVDVNQIESNLLGDTKIVLHNVQLKPQLSTITPKNTMGLATKLYITGFVQYVAFSWSWSVASGRSSWVKEAVLTITGIKVKAQLIPEQPTQDSLHDEPNNSNHSVSDECSKLNAEADEHTAQEIQKEGGIYGYLSKQVEMIVDALKLNIIGFEMTIEMPGPTVISDDDGDDIAFSRSFSQSDGDDDNDYMVSIVLGGKTLQIVSHGRFYDDQDTEMLKETLSIHSLYINVIETYKHNLDSSVDDQQKSDTKTTATSSSLQTYPVLDPFSYGIEVSRMHGKRFGSLIRGLVATGGQQFADIQDQGISFHSARPQIEAFGQLCALLLVPPEEAVQQNETTQKDASIADKNTSFQEKNDDQEQIDDGTNDGTALGDVSVFDFTIDSAMLDAMGDVISIMGVSVHYLADGTELNAKVDLFHYTSPATEDHTRGSSAHISDISCIIRPNTQVEIGSVNTLYLPNLFELNKPMNDVKINLIGETWAVRIDSFDGTLPEPPEEDEVARNSGPRLSIKRLDSRVSNVSEASASALPVIWVAPFPSSCMTNTIRLIKGKDDNTEVTLNNVEFFMSAEADRSGTRLACTIERMGSNLANATNMKAYTVLPAETGSNIFRNFAFSADNVSVTAGYSVQDWINTFKPGGRWLPTHHSSSQGPTDYYLPYAEVAPLKMEIAYSALSVVSVKETAFRVKEFKGEKDTTMKDLANFYALQCLSRADNFLENADVLGLNVESALGATLGWGSPFGPLVGIAAVVGVDSVRNTIEAGKRSRHAEEGERGHAFDFFRGIGYSAAEATQRGMLRRGCTNGKGNVVDWVVGTTENTGEYLDENKDKIGAAGGAGTGALIGMALGGPIGAMIGGAVGGVSTGAAIRTVDKQVKKHFLKHKEKAHSELSNENLRPGQLTLDGT